MAAHARADFASAALRHLSAAERLVQRVPDEAWYLAGYVPECALKAGVGLPWADKTLGHDISDPQLLGWVIDLDTAMAPLRDIPRGLHGWAPQLRYAATGATSVGEARAAVRAAQDIALPALSLLWTMGRWAGEPWSTEEGP